MTAKKTKKPAKKLPLSDLRARQVEAKQRAARAKKEAQDAKQRARDARRVFKEAKKIARRAKAELEDLSAQMKKLIGAAASAAISVSTTTKGEKQKQQKKESKRPSPKQKSQRRHKAVTQAGSARVQAVNPKSRKRANRQKTNLADEISSQVGEATSGETDELRSTESKST